ncbi:MAG TPA: asparagine synthase (glutamine-hydrolyzing) [Gemmatimonadales bacterium]|nr:asparagine synthase (glutamine-hydrolyzing) [Gemmatimonadales bacterium]
MCGIAGIIRVDPSERVSDARLARMRDVLRHRGPDDAASWIEGPAGLASRRLAIIDVAGGRQPMANEDGSVRIAYNGELYNHLALREELEAGGHRYRTRADTESILHLYEEVGEHCVQRLRGMFAFGLWDQTRRRLLLARDRLGIKPLYYAVTDEELLFASEIKAILAAGVRGSLNEAVLPELLASRFIAGEETLFEGIRKLLPGRTLTWSPGVPLIQRRYWHLPQTIDERRMPLAERARDVRERLEEAVASHLMSDVPLGVFLSGGLDSSGIAALMAARTASPIRTFAVGFAEPGANELRYARLAAQRVRSEHHEVVVTPAQFFEALPRLIWHEDEPIAFPSSIPLYFVSRLARERGVTVVLTGEGADELFLGYPRYQVTPWNARLGAAYRAVTPGRVRAGVREVIPHLPWRARRYARRSFLALDPTPHDLVYENFAVFPAAMQRSLLAGDLSGESPYGHELRYFEEAPGGLLERMSHADLQTYLVELLMKQDQMSMAASVESRVPFLDHPLVEYAAALPAGLKLRGRRTKLVLREALRDLVPPEILTRRKMGFPTPVSAWLRGSYRTVVDELVLGPRALRRRLFDPAVLHRLAAEHRAGLVDHGDRLWLLANLELWQRIFLDGEASASASPGMTACPGRTA